jgi:nitroreductase
MELSEALRTTPATRAFTDLAIDDETLYAILDDARFAPSGGNRQGWRVIVVKDAATRRALRDLYLSGWYEYLAQSAEGMTPFNVFNDLRQEAAAAEAAETFRARAAQSGGGMAEHLDEVPALLLVIADLSALATVDRDLDRYSFAGGASIYPFVWNILLAARDRGLGGVITTMPIRKEPALKELFELPQEIAVAALVVLGQPTAQVRSLRRLPVEGFSTVDRFDGPPFTG